MEWRGGSLQQKKKERPSAKGGEDAASRHPGFKVVAEETVTIGEHRLAYFRNKQRGKEE